MVSTGLEALVNGGGVGIAFTLGILNAYSHWKAGQYDYQLAQKDRGAALPPLPAKRSLVLK